MTEEGGVFRRSGILAVYSGRSWRRGAGERFGFLDCDNRKIGQDREGWSDRCLRLDCIVYSTADAATRFVSRRVGMGVPVALPCAFGVGILMPSRRRGGSPVIAVSSILVGMRIGEANTICHPLPEEQGQRKHEVQPAYALHHETDIYCNAPGGSRFHFCIANTEETRSRLCRELVEDVYRMWRTWDSNP